MKVAVSILSSNYSEEDTILKVNETDAEFLHVDVMDGHFVSERTPKYNSLHLSTKPLNVHLMVSRVFDYISQFSVMNTESITIHRELEDDLKELLEYIKSRGIKCGLAINPETPITALNDYFELLDEVLIMTVHPGRGGQKLIEDVIPKIDELKRIKEENKYNFQIFVDGGINDTTIDKVKNADVVISGSYVCKSENYQEQIDKLRLLK